MAKDTSLSKEERRAARKAAKTDPSATTEANGVTKSKSDKKEKKEKKEKLKAALEASEDVAGAKSAKKTKKVADEVVSEDEDEETEGARVASEEGVQMVGKRPVGALVPFANPLADDKVGKKVFRSVKKAAAHRTLKRGVKEVVKALRKSSTTAESSPVGIVVLAADISPMDVISHIPVLCEDHSIPYIYVTSRAELGMAGQTKRPTSVVMVGRDVPKGKKGEASGDGEDWAETYKGLVKVVEREGKTVKV